jgi:3-oxoadipate enol-lactonase
MTHEYVTVQGGARLAYRFDGPAGAPVVVLSNSLMSTMAMWEPQLPALTRHFRVLRHDTRGHGASDTTPGPYTIAFLADDVIAMLDALGLGQVHFVGLSMGGMIGQQLGAVHGDRLRSLALCDTTSEMPDTSVWKERLEVARRDGVASLAESTIQRWFTPPFIAREPATVARIRAGIEATGLEGYLACSCAVRDVALRATLHLITTPTLIIAGESDPACTVAQAEVIHREIPGSRLEVIRDAAHLSNIEQPERFNSLLTGFLLAIKS